MAAALSLAVAGCGGDEKKPESSTSSAPSTDTGKQSDNTPVDDQPDPNVKLAELKGAGNVLLTINAVERDPGGFVTVSGQIKNQGTEIFVNNFPWRGTETEVVRKNGNSVAGATLVDDVGKKRYYILRDTDGRCLCTNGINPIKPGESIPVFMQFPAPPEGTSEVEFSLPTFPTATLKIAA
ncbi:hypothetical protein NLX86_13370 [Streptomyces sp. A3M-1-3]|uniref:hypothetical protein n=1 Tax=Streptomyces sp. A3M-1-3 TaxID=2962044 RepID=UPI0020B6E932|nr:hypothetical protein [Streptomyces sp. A3M-1-3]MCP3819068.1 hypothetical protein [Streptomyces sp. A3M-1-3]